MRIQLCKSSISFFMFPPGGHVLRVSCTKLLRLITLHRENFPHLLDWAQWHPHWAGHHRVNQSRRAQCDTHLSDPSLFSLQPAWSRCCRQAGCLQWLLGIPLCSLLPRLHQWHRYGLALKTVVMLLNRPLDGHVLEAQLSCIAPGSCSWVMADCWAVCCPLEQWPSVSLPVAVNNSDLHCCNNVDGAQP